MCLATILVTQAALSHAAEFWSDKTTITQLYPHGAGFTFIVQYSSTLSTCGGNRWALSLANPNYKALAASLMLAYSLGQQIQIHVNDQPASCEPEVDRFIVYKP